MKISKRQAEVQEKAKEHGLTLTKTDIAKLPWTLWHHEEAVAQAKTLNEISSEIDKFVKNAFEVVKYGTGTLHRGITETHETLNEAQIVMRSYTIEEMYDKDDYVILFEILGNGNQIGIDSFRPEQPETATEPEPVEPAQETLVPTPTLEEPPTPPTAQPKVKYVEVYERYSPKNKDLLSFSTSILKAEVLETLNLKNAAQAAKWAKSQGMNGIDLCYKAHWAALAERVREYTMQDLNDVLDGAA